MTPYWIQRRAAELRKHWSTRERQRRAGAARAACARLAARLETPTPEPLTIWAAGAMSLGDLARLAS